MSTELERQLRAGFGRLPKPTREASARARAAALDALGPQRRRSRGGLLLVAFAVAFVVGAGAAALAATGKLHVRLGTGRQPARPVPSDLSVPAGSHGIAVVAGGKLWLATRSGLRIEGMPVSAAELSPRALYAVVGIGSSLITLAPGNRRPWVHQTDGRVVSAAWSPDGLKIAYVVARRGADELRLIEGDGSPDRLLVRRVRPVRPSWRADSLAVAYVDAHGRAAVFDLSSGLRRTFDTRRLAAGRAGRARRQSCARRFARAALGHEPERGRRRFLSPASARFGRGREGLLRRGGITAICRGRRHRPRLQPGAGRKAEADPALAPTQNHRRRGVDQLALIRRKAVTHS
jgi:hypothetical protein